MKRVFARISDSFFLLPPPPPLGPLDSPAGVFEFPNFATGSKAMLDACLEAEKSGSTVIVGGGDTATVVANYKAEEGISHCSTGGGASLELLEGKTLPGVAELSEK